MRGISAERWRVLSGSDNWEGLLDPLDSDLSKYLIHYGAMNAPCGDAFINEPASKNRGLPRYARINLFKNTGLVKGNPLKYEVTKYFYASSGFTIPGYNDKPARADAVLRESNWIGYVAVATDEEKVVDLGKRDILIVWRGTVRLSEAISDITATFVNAPLIFGQNSDPLVHRGFYEMYTISTQDSQMKGLSARDQLTVSGQYVGLANRDPARSKDGKFYLPNQETESQSEIALTARQCRQGRICYHPTKVDNMLRGDMDCQQRKKIPKIKERRSKPCRSSRPSFLNVLPRLKVKPTSKHEFSELVETRPPQDWKTWELATLIGSRQACWYMITSSICPIDARLESSLVTVQQVRAEVERLVKLYQDDVISITVTGHSLGASLATLNAVDLAVNNKDVSVTALLYASPKVGDENFKNAFSNQQNLRALRISDVHDFIPTLPLLPAPKDGTTPEGNFEPLGDFDYTQANKYQDALKDEKQIPIAWFNIKDKGMVQQDKGNYILDDHEPDDNEMF
nr:phospholipase A1-II 4-like [Ipomoea batatas]